jgi:serine/threonine protein kinase
MPPAQRGPTIFAHLAHLPHRLLVAQAQAPAPAEAVFLPNVPLNAPRAALAALRRPRTEAPRPAAARPLAYADEDMDGFEEDYEEDYEDEDEDEEEMVDEAPVPAPAPAREPTLLELMTQQEAQARETLRQSRTSREFDLAEVEYHLAQEARASVMLFSTMALGLHDGIPASAVMRGSSPHPADWVMPSLTQPRSAPLYPHCLGVPPITVPLHPVKCNIRRPVSATEKVTPVPRLSIAGFLRLLHSPRALDNRSFLRAAHRIRAGFPYCEDSRIERTRPSLDIVLSDLCLPNSLSDGAETPILDLSRRGVVALASAAADLLGSEERRHYAGGYINQVAISRAPPIRFGAPSTLAAFDIIAALPRRTTLIPLSELQAIKVIGEGSFGSVMLCRLFDKLVAVKKVVVRDPLLPENREKGIQPSDSEFTRLCELAAEVAVLHGVSDNQVVGLTGVCLETDASCIVRRVAPIPTDTTEQPDNFRYLVVNNATGVARHALGYELVHSVYVVSEYCPYGSVEQLLNRLSQSELILPPLLTIRYLRGIATACLKLHERGISHSDLKPGNVLIGEDFSVKLCDFGLSSRSTQSERLFVRTQFDSHGETVPHLVGTPCYMAPETLCGVGSRKGDIYAFGMMAFEFITGFFPFELEYQAEKRTNPRARIDPNHTDLADRIRAGYIPEIRVIVGRREMSIPEYFQMRLKQIRRARGGNGTGDCTCGSLRSNLAPCNTNPENRTITVSCVPPVDAPHIALSLTPCAACSSSPVHVCAPGKCDMVPVRGSTELKCALASAYRDVTGAIDDQTVMESRARGRERDGLPALSEAEARADVARNPLPLPYDSRSFHELFDIVAATQGAALGTDDAELRVTDLLCLLAEVTRRCWAFSPHERPDFGILSLLLTLLEREALFNYADGNRFLLRHWTRRARARTDGHYGYVYFIGDGGERAAQPQDTPEEEDEDDE